MIPYLPHATLQAHRGYDDPPCPGMLNIVEQSLSVWELECDVCHEPWSLPAGQATPEMRAQAKLEQAKRWRAQAGIPRLLRDWRFDRIGYADMKPQVLAAARAWATGEKPGLLLSGPVGVGKTTLAAAAANARLDHVRVRWISVPALFARLSLAWEEDERNDALKLLDDETAIVLDDIDKTRPTERAAEMLFLAIDRRTTEGSSLLVTTNLAPSDLAQRFPSPYGHAIASRLAGHCQQFVVQGSDRRLDGFDTPADPADERRAP